MKICDVELDFSYTNPAHWQKYKDARRLVAAKYSGLQALNPDKIGEDAYIELLSEGIHAFCDFFDAVFGEGTANRMFGEQTDFETVVDAYAEFIADVQQQAVRLHQKLAAFAPDEAEP